VGVFVLLDRGLNHNLVLAFDRALLEHFFQGTSVGSSQILDAEASEEHGFDMLCRQTWRKYKRMGRGNG
jgi:hypothetical protein